MVLYTNEFIRYLKSNEWNVELYETPLTDKKIKSALSRYPFVSGEYLEFLKTVKRCINKDETVWFNCIDDFLENNKNLLRWNEFELSFYLFSDSEEQCNEMVDFWKNHIPILIILKDSSQIDQYKSKNNYYALRKDGKIIKGYGYKYDNNDNIISNSFGDFLFKLSESDKIST